MIIQRISLQDLLISSKDGDWGQSNPTIGHTPYAVIRGTDFDDVALGINDKVPVRFLSDRTVDRRRLQTNDILIETAGGSALRPTGRTMLINSDVLDGFSHPVTCASFARFLRVDQTKADPRYVFWYLRMLYASGQIEQYQIQHTGVARFQYTQFAKSHLIPVPPMKQQRAISDILCAIDDKIVSNTRVVDNAEKLALATVRQQIMGSPVRVSLGEISEITRGVAPRYIDNDAGLMVLNQRCIRDQRVTLSAARKTIAEQVPQSKHLHVGDVLVNSTGVGTLGRVARWTNTIPATVDSHVSIIRFDESKVEPTCAGFSVLLAQSSIEMLGEGSTGQTELSRQQLARVEIACVPREAEATTATKLVSLSTLAETYTKESGALAVLRDALLPQLISGILRVRGAEEQVEDVL